MKFRLKIGHLYGPLNPDSNNGRTYGVYMVPWIKSVKATLGSGLKETKGLADALRDSVELCTGTVTFNGPFEGASIDVDVSQFPFLMRHANMPKGISEFIEVIEGHSDGLELACTVGKAPYEISASKEVIKDALHKLIDMHSWVEARRLCEVLEDLDDV